MRDELCAYLSCAERDDDLRTKFKAHVI